MLRCSLHLARPSSFGVRISSFAVCGSLPLAHCRLSAVWLFSVGLFLRRRSPVAACGRCRWQVARGSCSWLVASLARPVVGGSDRRRGEGGGGGKRGKGGRGGRGEKRGGREERRVGRGTWNAGRSRWALEGQLHVWVGRTVASLLAAPRSSFVVPCPWLVGDRSQFLVVRCLAIRPSSIVRRRHFQIVIPHHPGANSLRNERPQNRRHG